MNIQIKNRRDRSIIFEGDFDCLLSAIHEAHRKNADLCNADLCNADLCGADLCGANLCGANLCGADLCGANLRNADLRNADLCNADLCNADLCGADLCNADLCGANLRSADLRDADLCDVKNLNLLRTSALYLLREQPGSIRSYKLVTENLCSPLAAENGGATTRYAIGESYEVPGASTDEQRHCAAGIHLASADWIIANWRSGDRVLIAEHTASDIAAIPIGSDGKYRVFRCKIVGEKSLSELGLGEVSP